MSTNRNHDLETLLGTLGQARRDGAFSKATACPGQTAASKASERSARHLGWLGVAGGLAAAAAVAVFFVGPNLRNSRQSQTALNSPISLPSETANQLADAGKPQESAATFNCDYNGDGVIDGRDIQAFMDRLKDVHGDPRLQAEYLQRCLLGN